MQTISLRGRVGDDRILRLEVLTDTPNEEVEVVVVIQSSSSHPILSLDELAGVIDDETLTEVEEPPQKHIGLINTELRDWVDALYGSCADDPIERPDQQR